MTKATFLRLLDTPISEKGDRLRQQIADINDNIPIADVFVADPINLAVIPGSPFAYWINQDARRLFQELPTFGDSVGPAVNGHTTGDDFRFVRAYWEVAPGNLATSRDETTHGKRWAAFAKGGNYNPFYSDIHLIIDWANDGQFLRSNPTTFLRNDSLQFKAGITWPLRAPKFGTVPLPKGTIFSVRGYGAFSEKVSLKVVLGVTNSAIFDYCYKLLLGRFGFPEFVVGVLIRLPWPKEFSSNDKYDLEQWVGESIELKRFPFSCDETSRIFCLPAILRVPGIALAERITTIAQSEVERQNALVALQIHIDTRVAELYGVRELVSANQQKIENIDPSTFSDGEEPISDEENDEGDITSPPYNPSTLISDTIMWCVGIAFGRWDVRYTLDPINLPALPGPFDPLPVCSPCMLKGADGLPLNVAPQDYPLKIASRGFLVDDPDRPQDDIINAVRAVIQLIWREQAETVENEACQILGVPDLRTWFRDPKGFFAWHTKRYSKSRRKAPIYWLIQSAKKNYAIWMYYPRLNPDSLFYAAREYADAKYNLENTRLDDMENQLKTTSGSSRKAQEKKVAAQTALVAELKSYIKALDAAALLQIKPDLNDGVLLNMAPLRELVPWKEPARIWDELLHGKNAWSHIATELRQKGLIKGT